MNMLHLVKSYILGQLMGALMAAKPLHGVFIILIFISLIILSPINLAPLPRIKKGENEELQIDSARQGKLPRHMISMP